MDHWISFNVGGKLTRQTLDELLALAGMIFPDEPSDVDGALAAGTAIIFSGDRKYGTANEMEAFCQKHGLAYQMSVHGDSSSVLTFWRPGDAKPRNLDADGDGEPLIGVPELGVLAANGASLQSVVDALELARPGSVPALELVPAT